MIKRTLFIMIVLCIPLSAMAMKPMDDGALEEVSGQSGVSIMVDITMDIHIDTIAWGDSDGLSSGPYNPWSVVTKGGYVGINNLTVSGLSVTQRALLSSPSAVSFWPYASTINVVNGVPYYQVYAGQGIR